MLRHCPCPCTYDKPLDGHRISPRRSRSAKWTPKNLVIIVLAIAVAVLGYLYYESQQQRVVVDLPNLKIETK